MRIIRFMLLLLSIIQLGAQGSFWRGDFFWFFIWIIAFQLNWFYVDKSLTKKLMLGLLSVLALVNVLTLPLLPILMLALLAIEFRMNLSLKETGFCILGLVFLIVVASVLKGSWPSINEGVMLISVSFISLWATVLVLEIEKRDVLRYEQLLAQEEAEEKANLLKAQMDAMQEVYTLNERNRISRDLHDSVGHTLSTLVIQLAAIAKITEESSPQASEMLTQLHDFTKDGLANVRQVIHEMKPNNYRRIAFIEQIASMIREFEANSQIRVYFNYNAMQWVLNEAEEVMIYRAIQEFLSNSAKHSEANEIRIQYHFTPKSLILTMMDNGKGIAEIKPQMGLTGMKERAKLLGAKVNIQSKLGAGFTVRIVLMKGGIPNDAITD